MKSLKNIFTLTLIIIGLQSFAQESVIRGTVIEDATGEALIGVAVVIEGTSTGAATDLDGQFQIKALPGTYNITVSFISFAPITISDVVVKSGEATALGTIRLQSSAQQLQAVEITAKAVTNTEAALVTMKRKSANVMDGVSAASFKKVGDSDAASAVARVTGVSVQGGKYIYVRGLGDRYTKTLLNGISIPGLDPDKNSVQMDIFPTNIINNIVVYKSFTADLPADFTGGAVDIEVVDFPEKKAISANVGLGYNPAMNLNNNYITYNGSSTDFLGYDNGTRDIPTAGKDIPLFAEVVGNPEGEKGQQYIETLNNFNSQMGGYRSQSFLNTSLSFSAANQIATKGKYSLGYVSAISYKNEYEFYENAEFNLYGKDNNKNAFELTPLELQKGDYGVNNVLLGGMVGLALKTDRSKVRVNVMHLQNGESKAGIFDYTATNQGTTFQAKQYNLEYSERGLTNVLVNGTHRLANPDWEFEWKLSPTRSTITDPDIRFLRFGVENGEINPRITTEIGLPERIWRFLEEYNVGANTDFTKKYTFRGQDAKLKFGASYNYKVRDFNIQNFQIGLGNTEFTGNPNEVFAKETLFSSDNRQGVQHNPLFVPNNRNQYNSYVHHESVYASTELKPSALFKAIIGLRAEKYDQFYTGTNQTGSLVLDNENVLSTINLFPTANLIYAVNEKSNLRFSYSKTTARPSFKELSFAEILDPITGRTFVGGLFSEQSINGGDTTLLWDGNLQSTQINNFDLRYEYFQGIGQTIALSAFYKTFSNPIEIVQFLSDPGTFQARNVGDATVIGAEFELIQALGIFSERLEKLSFNTNITVTRSSIALSQSELQSRRNSAKDGETVDTRRAMAGQAPYLINVGVSYNDTEKGLQANISYNVQGETLEFVGFGNRTDVYSVPFNSLNVKVGKTFGKDDKMNVSLKVSNLLNDDKEKVFRGFQAQDQIFQSLRPQRTLGVSFGYKF